MNRICMIGRLTNKPELKYTGSNLAVTKFTVAVNRIKKEDGADFINCVAWQKQAENICNYLDKGSRVAIDGRLQTSTYEKQDGTKGYTTEVVAQNVEFLESKKSNQQTTNEQETKEVSDDPFADFGDTITTDDYLE